ncbi:unnamed protein product [Lasius platythorax]|uniref:Uncharacterized protein n=1 Tax=Lasius platythorax TaxID=488582 RepID=A0AAV2P110_9HYME
MSIGVGENCPSKRSTRRQTLTVTATRMPRRGLPYVNRGDDPLSLQHAGQVDHSAYLSHLPRIIKIFLLHGPRNIQKNHDEKSKYGEDGGSKSRREQWDNERDEEKVADIKRKQSRCDLTRTRPGPYVKDAPSALRIVEEDDGWNL